jgi:hypothetical protein
MNRGPHKIIPANPDDEDQSKRFVEKARELGADKEESAADSVLGRLAKMPPDPKNKRRSTRIGGAAPKKASILDR